MKGNIALPELWCQKVYIQVYSFLDVNVSCASKNKLNSCKLSFKSSTSALYISYHYYLCLQCILIFLPRHIVYAPKDVPFTFGAIDLVCTLLITIWKKLISRWRIVILLERKLCFRDVSKNILNQSDCSIF